MTKSSNLKKLLPIICLVVFSQIDAKTRWSSLHQIPDADFIEGSKFVLDLQCNNIYDTTIEAIFLPYGTIKFGISEWINIEVGYAGKAIFGMKTKLLDDMGYYVPSIAIGIDNLFSHKDAYFNDYPADILQTELYLSFSKSIEPIKLRAHLGAKVMAYNHKESFNVFFGLEKYFGAGFYLTLETFSLGGKYHFSAFASYRFFKTRLEVFAGMADLGQLINGKDISLASEKTSAITRPGIRFGLRLRERWFALGKHEGIEGLEDHLRRQDKTISELRQEVDSLRTVQGTPQIIEKPVAAAEIKKESEIKKFTKQKLKELKHAFEKEPFEPLDVNVIRDELVISKDSVTPVLHEIAMDMAEESRIRSLAISCLGEFANSWAADLVMDILDRVNMRDLKIEAIIALGKLKETRAIPMIQQLTGDTDEAVAFTASEVLKKIIKEAGIVLEPSETVPNFIPEQKIGSGDSDIIPEIDTESDITEENIEELKKPKEQKRQKNQRKEQNEKNQIKQELIKSPIPAEEDTSSEMMWFPE
ncbi:MAG: HEAT repeat domain-containing protein [Fibrobacter sp.]|nr:HEAT repeat domain-containing protein [Fibrobacter sp.]